MNTLFLALTFFLSVCQVCVAQTTQPFVNLENRSSKDTKVLFYPMPFAVSQWGANPNPPGTLPYVCVGGGSYEATGGLSYWVGGYWGVGGTSQRPAAWENRWQSHDKNLLQVAVDQYPPGMFYQVNVEHWPTDIRKASTWVVEGSIRKFRAMIRDIREVKPDLRVCIWGVLPPNEYYTTTLYGRGMDAWSLYQAGEELSPEEWQALAGVAVRMPTGSWVLSSSAEASKNYKLWFDSAARLTYGLDNAGNKVVAGGLLQALDALCLPCYDHIAGIESDYYIKYSVMASRQLAPKKKVFVVLCPSYVGEELVGKPIPVEEWNHSLLVAFSVADGVMLWDSKPIGSEYWLEALKMQELLNR